LGSNAANHSPYGNANSPFDSRTDSQEHNFLYTLPGKIRSVSIFIWGQLPNF
jgi:hypothetical protein